MDYAQGIYLTPLQRDLISFGQLFTSLANAMSQYDLKKYYKSDLTLFEVPPT